MTFRLIFALIFVLVCRSAFSGDELVINPNHPDKYTVVTGDTLWDISGKFLQHPWQWPQLWHNNPQIKDPHWIYPGDTLYFSYVNGVPRLSLSPEGLDGQSAESVLEPRIRESSQQQAIKIIPTDAISQFLSSPQVVTEEEINNAPYMLQIAGSERLIAAAGDNIYVRSITHPTGLGYTIYRKGLPYIDPETREVLGFEAGYVGDATLLVAGDPATLTITKASMQIHQGDRLMHQAGNGLALNYFPKPPEKLIEAYIIKMLGEGGITQIGLHDIVVLSKGSRDGLEAGHVLNIYRSGRIVNDRLHTPGFEDVKLPDELAGVLMVFRPFERVSYALVMEAEGAIHILDRVKTP
jgi:LysM domain